MDTRELMTIQEAADELKVSRRAIYDAIDAGRLQADRVLGKWAVRRASLNGYIPRALKGRRENRRPVGVKGPGGRPPKMRS